MIVLQRKCFHKEMLPVIENMSIKVSAKVAVTVLKLNSLCTEWNSFCVVAGDDVQIWIDNSRNYNMVACSLQNV